MKSFFLATGVLISLCNLAYAVTLPRATSQAPVNNCRSALPSFERALRKRPLGMINVSGNDAFISCAVATHTDHSSGITSLKIDLVNRGAAGVAVSCTLVNGLTGDDIEFFPRSTNIEPGTARSIVWQTTDHDGLPFGVLSTSCAIPPNVEIIGTGTSFDIDVGL